MSAPDRGYSRTPITVSIPTPKPPTTFGAVLVTDAESGGLVPSTDRLETPGQAEVTWIVRDLAQGTTRTYRLAFTDGTQPNDGSQVSVTEAEGEEEGKGRAVTISIGDELFTRYWYQGAPKPYCYPVIGPTGKPVTRAYPMENVPGESQDHPHQRSFWCTFGEVNGHDFWAESEDTGRQVHRTFETLASGRAYGLLRAVNDWIASSGEKVCEEVRELRVYNVTEVRLLDFTTTVKATEGPVEFGDTKEGMFGFRVASTMRLQGGEGRIINSEGHSDDDTWGKRAAWCDYYGPVEGQTVGIGIFDHPGNLRHPTYWHVRNYGLFAANPFGLRHFIGDQTGAGRYTLPQGEELTFRYRILIHPGTAQEARVADWYEEYAHSPVTRVQAEP